MTKIKNKYKIEVLLEKDEYQQLEMFRLGKGWTMAELLRRAIKMVKEQK